MKKIYFVKIGTRTGGGVWRSAKNGSSRVLEISKPESRKKFFFNSKFDLFLVWTADFHLKG
jgi:hypothetical protein